MTAFYLQNGVFPGLIASEIAIQKPSITSWQRLESDPSELDLAAGLEAQIADPLWSMGRQWQFAELHGEDAGMPIEVIADIERAPLGLEGGVAGADSLPEPLIEAERADDAVASIAAEAGVDFRRAMIAAGQQARIEAFVKAYPLVIAPPASGVDPAGHRLATLMGSDGVDAVAMAAAIEAARGADGTIILPADIDLNSAARDAVTPIVADWLDDWASLLVRPGETVGWRDDRLDYAFDLTLEEADADRRVSIDGYPGGALDWWALDEGKKLRSATREAKRETYHRIPMPVRFPGMAADRLFEFEDGAVNLGPTTVGPTGIATMLLLEYVVSSSNDYYQLPITLDYGHAYWVRSLRVIDTFGQEIAVPAAARGAAGWSMFEVTGADGASDDGSLFVMPSVASTITEGDPIEEVLLFRDELANLAWAAERRVSGVTPKSIVRPLDKREIVHRALDGPPPDAAFIYRLQSGAPTNWYPMVAEGDVGQVDFQLKQLRYAFATGDAALQPPPETALLRQRDDKHLTIRENALPRDGVILSRSFQMARDAAGNRYVWLGRRKRIGTGEGSSRMTFDTQIPTPSA